MKIARQNPSSPTWLSEPAWALLVTVTVGMALSQPASAATIHVRGKSHLDVSGHRGANGVDIAGRLQSDDKTPIERATLQVRVAGAHPRTVVTDSTGAFGVRVPTPDADRSNRVTAWQIRYDGGRLYGPAAAAGSMEWERRSARVDIEVTPQRTTLDGPEMKVSIWVRESDGALGIPNAPVSLRFDAGPSRLATTGRNGQVTLTIDPGSIGATGRFPVRAVYGGSDVHSPSIGITTAEVLRPTRLNLAIGREGGLDNGRYRFSGRLVDELGPVGGATITLVSDPSEIDDDPLGLAVTDLRGIYVAGIGTRELAARFGNSVSVGAVYAPTDLVHATTASASARLALPGPEGVPIDWYLSCAAVLLGLLLLGQTLRSGLWAPLALWRRLKRRKEVAVQSALGELHPAVIQGAIGDSLRSGWVAGTIVDLDSSKLTPGAQCQLTGPHGEEHALEGSTFTAGPLPEGEWRMEVTAPGYLPLELPFVVPHNGHLDGATYGLTSIRSYARSVFTTTLHRLDRPFKWGWDTPAEVVSATERAPALTRLRLHIEAIWFGPEETTEGDAKAADAIAAELDAEVGR